MLVPLNVAVLCMESKLDPNFNDSQVISEVVVRMSRNQIKQNGIFTIIESVNSLQSRDFKNFIIKNLSTIACVRSEVIHNFFDLNKRRRRFVIISIEEYQQFLEFHNELNDSFSFGGIYVIVMLKGRIKETQSIYKLCQESQIYNVDIVYENHKNEIVIETFEPFTSTSCSDTKPLIINKFKNGEFKKEVATFFPNKIKRLFGCPISVATAINAEPYVLVEKLENGSYDVSGRDIKLLKTIAEKLNFTIFYSHIEDEGYLFTNGSAGGIIKRLLHNETEMIIADFWLKANRLKYFKALTAYSFEKLILVIPNGKEFQSYEKIFRPLSSMTWILLMIAICTGVLVIFIISQCPPAVRSFVFGTDVKYPNYNLLINFIGGVQPILPRRNFARFILTNFVIFSLVIRTVYFGSYYDVLHSNKRHKEVQSIDEINEKKFKVLMLPVFNDLYTEDSKIFDNPQLIDSRQNYYQILDEIAKNDNNENKAVLGGASHILYLNQKNSLSDNPERKKLRYQICKERLMLFSTVIYVRKHFYLSDSVDYVIEQLKTSGLIDYWHKQSFMRENFDKIDVESKIPEKIRFEHVKGPFQFLAIGLGFCSIIFLIEIVYEKLSSRLFQKIILKCCSFRKK